MAPVEHRVRAPGRFTRLAAVLVLAALVLFYKGGAMAEPAAGDAGGIYFSVRAAELKLWVDSKSGNLLPPPGGVLLTPELRDDAGKAVTAPVTYRLTSPTSPGQTPNLAWLTVDAKTGTLKVTQQRVLSDAGAQRRHVVWLDARVPSLPAAPLHRSARPYMVPADRARMNLTITLELVQEDRPCVNKPEGPAAAREDPCHYCHDACFWLAAELQVWENKEATRLGAIGHRLADVPCGDKPAYTLKNGTEFFEVRDGDLWSKANLDRDAGPASNGSAPGPGSLVLLDIECRAPWGSAERRVVAVHVLDEDDNAPELQEQGKLEYNFTTEAQLARGAHLLVKDLDSRAANRFGELQVEDPSGVVTHKKLEFDVTHVGVQHTLISIRLQVKDAMESRYNVSLTLTDATLREGAAGKDLRMDVTMWGPPVTPPVAMSSSKTDDAAPAVPPVPSRRRRRSAFNDEQDQDDAENVAPIQLLSSALQFARIAQLGERNDGKVYVLSTKSSGWGAVGVTREMGILYVANASAIVRGQDDELHYVTVEVFSQGAAEPDRALAVTIQVRTDPQPSYQCQHSHQRNQTCAMHKTRKTCEKSCGVGTGSVGSNGSVCYWRDLSPTSTNVVMMATKKYATCSSDLVTCPDTKCDPLEQLDPRVCPQDCTDRVINGVYCETRKVHGGDRGMCQCAQVGACDDNGCQCHLFEKEKGGEQQQRTRRPKGGKRREQPWASPSPNSTSPQVEAPRHESCGSSCQAIIMSCVLGSILAVSLYACWLRRSRAKKRASQTDRSDSEYQLRGASGTGAQPETYRHDRAASATLRQTVNADPRWEVPRSHLILHEEIGSGEFGRVLRGTLTAEEQGPATVAVKTLRSSASGAELRDLLSELELLKDVEHPNVIRLLGACTDPDGPVCVLLEYCGLGSLRGYLHRSRWTAAEDEDAALDKPDKDERPSMTPRKIISFAWQIAKGMDYLGQLKLVHRDLASRNVLLNENLVCKISDFGLSRDVYVDEAYCKLSAGKVPVKWMAPESLLLRVYTSKSDVWSFGVLLWELCTLGGAPYAGVAPHDMVALLAAGQRLARPEHCSRELYRVMQGCWHSEPQERPHFAQLVAILDGMLARGSGYMDLDARMVLNPEYFEEHPQVTGASAPLCPPCAEGYLRPQTIERGDVVRYENTAVT